jgi:gamma-glutamyltranspeptidase
LDLLCTEGIGHPDTIPKYSGHAVTVPGTAACWVDTAEKFGNKKVLLLIFDYQNFID